MSCELAKCAILSMQLRRSATYWVHNYIPVMYTVLSSLAACGCLGVAAAAAGVFVCHA